MIHFSFSDKDNRYLFLKCDLTPDEYVMVYEREVKKYVKHHIFYMLKKHINLTILFVFYLHIQDQNLHKISYLIIHNLAVVRFYGVVLVYGK